MQISASSSYTHRKITVKPDILSDSGDVFGEVVYDKSISLFILHRFIIKGSEIVRTSGSTFEKAVYAEEPIYVFRLTNNKIFVTRSLGSRNLYALSPGNKNKIKEFLKANKPGKSINNFYLRKLAEFLGTAVKE